MTERSTGGRAALAPSVRALYAVVDEVAPAGGDQPARRKQLRAVAGMWGRALGAAWPEDVRLPARSARSLFEPGPLEVFWELAVSGQLRQREDDIGRELPVASRRILRDCLGILAERVVPDRAVDLPEIPRQEPKSVVPRRQLGVLYRRLADMASDAPVERGGIALSKEDRVRMLALVAVVLDTGVRAAELEAQRLDDLGEDLGTLVVRRHPQNGAHLPVVVQECVLREGTQVALRRWLLVRDGLVAGVEGAKAALWVSLRPNQWQETKGLPLQSGGIQKAYGRGAVALNGLMAGRRGWAPLPTTLEQVRRAVDLDAVAVRSAGVLSAV